MAVIYYDPLPNLYKEGIFLYQLSKLGFVHQVLDRAVMKNDHISHKEIQCPEIGLRKSVKNADRTSLFREDVDVVNRRPLSPPSKLT